MTEKELIGKIRELRQIKPRKDWVSLTKSQILGESARGRASVSFFPFWKPALATVTAFGILFGVFSFAQNSLPGDILYSIKKITEKSQAVFVSEKELPKYNLEIANKRLDELTEIAQTNQVKKLAPAISEFQANMSEAAKSLATVKGQDVEKIVAQTKKLKPTLLIDTYIISGPKEGEAIGDTNEVTFEFKGAVSPKELENKLTFETKIEGLDENWEKTSSQKREINLPPGPKEYTFLVRAKINDSVDSTPARRTFKINTSSYFGKVKISSLQVGYSSHPSLITLSAYLKTEEKIDITGWQIRGKRGSFNIPKGIEKYHPFYDSELMENIIVKSGDTIYLSGAPNPLGRNNNFRPNKCLGYLANYHNFAISFPKNCPKPEGEEISYLDPCCQKFIHNLRECEAPNYSSNLVILGDSECTSYLTNNFNYDACFRKYSRDGDFLENQWHIYMEKDFTVSGDCDTLYLQDKNGLIVDKYSYGWPVCGF